MILERVVCPGIAHNSYLLGSGHDAAVIDPRRDCNVYLKLAKKSDVRIRHILETHRNEDYVIGSRDLAAATGAEILHGPGLDWKYGSTLTDGQEFKIGSLILKAIHTPGHTDESVSYVATTAKNGAALAVFSGDALFAGDVGRTDLYGPSEVKRLASALYESIFGRILPLGDEVILCPSHGSGSICGHRIADRDHTTIGIERKLNPFLSLKREEFVARKTSETPERPPYFTTMEKYNVGGTALLKDVSPPGPLTANEFRKLADEGALIIDTREPPAFGGSHIAGAYSIWMEGIPSFAGWLVPYDKPILLLLEYPSLVDEARSYLARLGYDNIAGYLKGGFETWYNSGLPVENLALLSVQHLKDMLTSSQVPRVLDVRDDDEWKSGHVPGAESIYVGHLEERVSEVPFGMPVAVFCSVGHRAGIGASILQRKGHPSVYNVLGGFQAWKAAGYPAVKG